MKIDTSGIHDFIDKPQKSQVTPGRTFPAAGADASLRVDYASLIDQAVQAEEADSTAVQRARGMILSGELESAENIRRAAENIVKFGI